MELRSVLEALLFVSQKPLSPREIREVLVRAAEAEDASEEARTWRKIREADVEAELAALAAGIEGAGRSYRLVCVAGAWQFVSRPEFAPWIRVLVGAKPRPPRLSQAALETLAIVAYRQPVTRAEIEEIRGVNVDGVMQTLLQRGLIQEVGRAETIGRPVTYGTTDQFLEYFGLRSLEDLPAADELRRWQPAVSAAPRETAPEARSADPGVSSADSQETAPAERSAPGADPPVAGAPATGSAEGVAGATSRAPDPAGSPEEPARQGLEPSDGRG
ncbi:SMC-Scp complex subunit ScpB [Limisphaera sp. 4302-co]|uniref:SMC-Scp complex subunit ScpB n=1 Tax=Limisphaera sp. 4302-co TaxID=3400417 RepID=UPI003C2982CB